jgi:hypothetical protein
MMMIEDKLFSLLRLAIWGESMKCSVSRDEFSKVLKLAKQQTVFGYAFDGLSQQNEKYDKQQVLKGFAVSQKIQRQNEVVNKELKELVLLFEQRHIDYLIVKGQTLGVLYPKRHLRMAGDIDFLIYREYGEVKDVIEEFFFIKLPERMVEWEIEFVHGGVPFELHTTLREWGKKRHNKVWDGLMEKEWNEKYYVEMDGVKVRTLSPTMNAAYIFIHLFFHFIREGVSLRQLCDWAMVLHYYKDEIDRQALLKILSELDVLDAFRTFGTILTDHLGLPKDEFPMTLGDDDRNWQGQLLKDIFGGGNFGKLHHQANNSLRFKIETMQLAFRNTFRYYRLCPSEIGGMIPRLVKGNLKILFSC